MKPTERAPGALLTTTQVVDLTGLGRTTLWKLTKRGEFPAPVKIGPRNLRFFKDEIDAWMNEIRASRDAA